jgi:hypothetical protein
MTFALIATILCAICMAVMLVADKLMLGDCYQGKPNHAWFVSSVAGGAFGLILTLLIWISIASLSEIGDFVTILEASINLLFWKGLLVMVAGACGVQVLFHYFHCFNEDAHSASIAGWIAATPIFVFCATVALLLFQSVFSVNVINESSISIHPIFILGAIVATIGLILFESVSNQVVKNLNNYRKDLALMLTFNVIGIILLQQVLVSENVYGTSLYIIALLPYYWIGFFAGARILLPKKERAAFKQNWRGSIRFSLQAILFVEVIGMLVFCFEYFGLSKLDPTYVSIIVGSHIFLVYFIDSFFIKFASRMRLKNQDTIKLLGLTVSVHNLPKEKSGFKTKIFERIAIFVTVSGIVMSSLYIQ